MALLTARDQLPTHPATPGELLAAAAAAARVVGRALENHPETLSAFADFGRWLADCPYCNAGIALHPAWPVAACFGCFRVYTAITWPSEREDIENVLERRPVAAQCWLSAPARTKFRGQALVPLPAETVAELVAENKARGVPVPEKLEPKVDIPVDDKPIDDTPIDAEPVPVAPVDLPKDVP